jgi:hypothetical protein
MKRIDNSIVVFSMTSLAFVSCEKINGGSMANYITKQVNRDNIHAWIKQGAKNN